MKAVICGKPSLVITKEGVDEAQLKKNNLDVSDLIESMRVAGYFNLDDVYYGLYEANGSFSALEKEEKTPTLALVVVDSGKADEHNMKLCGITSKALHDFLKQQGVKLKQVLVMTIDGNGRVYFQQRKKSYKILQIEVDKSW
jgi:uncharacterized membrane protein YcaP (DUF421 family)